MMIDVWGCRDSYGTAQTNRDYFLMNHRLLTITNPSAVQSIVNLELGCQSGGGETTQLAGKEREIIPLIKYQ